MTVPSVPLSHFLQQRSGLAVAPSTTYGMAGVFGFGMGLIIRENIHGSDTKYEQLTPLKAGDVVYSKVKAFEGAITIVPAIGDGRFVSPEFPVFDVSDAIGSEYLGHFLAWNGFVDQLRAKSNGIGARRERVHPTVLLGMLVPQPPLTEQRRIAAYLDSIQARIGQMIASRRNPWETIESALGGLQWNVPLRSLLHEDFDEIALESDGRYRQIGVFGGGRGVIDRGTFVGSSTKYTKMLRVRGGQVVMSRLKAFEGAVAVVPARHDGALVSKEFPTFSLAPDADPQFVRAILRSSHFEEHLRSKSVGLGARRERVDASRFLSITVPVPPPEVQRAIGAAARLAGRARALQLRSASLGSALLPAARNEVFSALR